MDLFLINGQDGISLPEMIDWDIKLSDSEISEEVGVNNLFGLGYDLPSLDIDEDPNPLWTQSYSGNSNSSFELDFLGEGASALMVNPSSVVPFVSSHRRIAEVKEETPAKSEGNSVVKKTNQRKQKLSETVKVEADFSAEVELKVEVVDEVVHDNFSPDVKINVDDLSEQGISFESTKSPKDKPITLEFVNVSMSNKVYEATPKKTPSYKRQVVQNIISSESFEDLKTEAVKTFPKPAYSYSCLIAMALKNSLTGSLPVSEIYSFMCHHFPYFKTAPNGWKNSVRHNLSLNKCFEKIEKQPSSGSSGSQRKGCLWAMNPMKISKMDEEVAKWSRKDPLAIKKAMIYPENLELLERGELKDLSAFNGDEATLTEDETEEEEVKDEEDDIGIEVDDERISPIDDEDSEDEISRVPPSLQPFEPKLAHLTRNKILLPANTSKKITELDFASEVDLEVGDECDMDIADTRTLYGLDEDTPIYAVDPVDENMLIELPMVKRPRVQASYIYQPVLNMKRHNVNEFRSIKIQSP